MRIPEITKRPRYYIATALNYAFASWSTVSEAKKCWERWKQFEPESEKRIKGIVLVDSSGRRWLEDKP